MSRKLSEYQRGAILVGDMHVDKASIPEAKRIIEWVVAGAKQIMAQATGFRPLIIFTGDQSNDFALIRAEVLEFWMWAFDYITAAGFESLSEVGNHDMNQEESASTMSVYDVRTVLAYGTKPIFVSKNTCAMGFIRDEEKFFKVVMEAYERGARTILCHAEFEGSMYENGTYAPHGFDLKRYPKDLRFITGHIHKRQEFGSVTCVGTPRPSTRSDIGEVKGIHVIDFETGLLNFVATPAEVAEPFRKIVIDEKTYNQAEVEAIPDSGKIYVDIHGSREFVKKVAKMLPPAVHERSVYTEDNRTFKLKESEGIPTSFQKFAREYFELNGVPLDLQKDIMQKALNACASLKHGVQ